MPANLYQPGYRHARDLIAAGKVDEKTPWTFSGEDAAAILGDGEDWDRYASWNLARRQDVESTTRGAWGYPFGKNGKVYRSALRAIRCLAAQNGDTDVFDAAGRLFELIDAGRESAGRHEVRMCAIADLGVESRDDGATSVLAGYAAVFDEETVIGGWFREIIRPGAFSRAIQEDQDVRSLWNHNPDYVLGRTKSGTLQLAEDDHGLKVTIQPPNTTWARDLVESIKRRDVSQMSFAFSVRKEAYTEGEDGELPLRELLDLDLYDVSPVTYPAYEATAISARSPANIVRTWLTAPADPVQEDWEPVADPARAIEQELESLRLRLELERLRHRITKGD